MRPKALSAAAITARQSSTLARSAGTNSRLDALRLERLPHPLAVGLVAPADHEAFGAAIGHEMGNGLAQTLCTTGDDGDFAR